MSLALTLLAVTTLLTPAPVLGNNWSVPCTSGTCTYAAAHGANNASSLIQIHGGNTTIGDVTPAGGWAVLDCDPDWSQGSHQVRLVCAGPQNQTENCAHLFQDGAENTVVRLPENCGKGPFARVANASVAANQSLPSNLTKRDLADPEVKSLTLDYNFARIPASRGNVSFSLTAANLKSQSLNTRGIKTYGHGKDKRWNPFSAAHSAWNSITSEVVSAATVVASAANSEFSVITSDAASVITSVASAVTSAAGSVASDITALTNGVNESLTLDPVHFDKDITLIDTSVQCNTASASGSATLHVDVDTKIDAQASFSLEMKGVLNSLPNLDLFKLTGQVNGEASATFNVQADVQGTFSTGSIQLFQQSFSPYTVPGIVTIGPELTVSGDLDMAIEMQADVSLTADWKFPQAQFTVPKSEGTSAGDGSAQASDNPLKLSADPSVNVSGSVTVHVIPRLDFGVDIADGLAKASVFMDVDLAGILNMDVSSQAITTAGPHNTTSSIRPTSSGLSGNATSSYSGIRGNITTTKGEPSGLTSVIPLSSSSAARNTTAHSDTSRPSTSTDSLYSAAPSRTAEWMSSSVIGGATKTPQPTLTPAPSTSTRRKPSRALAHRILSPRQRHSFIHRQNAGNAVGDAAGNPVGDAAGNAVGNTTVADTGPSDNSTAIDPGAETSSRENSGCIGLSASIVINVGIEGTIPPFIDETAQVPIFSKSFPNIFQKCFGTASGGQSGAKAAASQQRKRATISKPAAKDTPVAKSTPAATDTLAATDTPAATGTPAAKDTSGLLCGLGVKALSSLL